MNQIIVQRRKTFEQKDRKDPRPLSFVSYYIPVTPQSHVKSSINSLGNISIDEDSIFDGSSPTISEIEVPIFEGLEKRRSQYLSYCHESMSSRCNSVADDLEFSNVKDKMKLFDCEQNLRPLTFKTHYLPPKKSHAINRKKK